MKKWLLLVAGLLLFTATVEADCGSCTADAKDKAACEMKAKGCGATCEKVCGGKDKAACEMKAKSCGADCEKVCCEKDKACTMKKKQCGQDCKKPCCTPAEKKNLWQKMKFWGK